MKKGQTTWRESAGILSAAAVVGLWFWALSSLAIFYMAPDREIEIWRFALALFATLCWFAAKRHLGERP